MTEPTLDRGGTELGSASTFSLDGVDAALAEALAGAAHDILADPLLLRELSDRVYLLLQADLRIQRERANGTGRYRHG